MIKTSFEFLDLGIANLIKHSINNNIKLKEFYSKYNNYIISCGWSRKEFEDKVLSIIDANWDTQN